MRVIATTGLLDQIGVLRGVEQRAGLAGLGELEHDHPAAVRIGVDRLRLVLQRGVDLDDFAGDRRVQLRDRLDRFDGAERLALLERGADLRQLDVDDVAELLLRVVGDADLAAVAGRARSTRGLSCTSDRPDTPSSPARTVRTRPGLLRCRL